MCGQSLDSLVRRRMSVWQHWLIALHDQHGEHGADVLALLKLLLYHALRWGQSRRAHASHFFS